MLGLTQPSITPISDEVFSDLTTAQSLDPPATALVAQVQAQGGNVRFRIGEDPTTSVGGIIYDGNWHSFTRNLDRIELIEEDSGTKAYVIYGLG